MHIEVVAVWMLIALIAGLISGILLGRPRQGPIYDDEDEGDDSSMM